MGNAWQRLKKRFHNQEVRILMVGLDAAGKTTTLYKLKLGEVVTTIPTIGFNVETIKHQGFEFVTWDVSGRSGIRALWRHYYQNTNAIIFVIDSNDRERMDECKVDLWRLLEEDELNGCSILVLANKQDLPNAMSTEEVTEKLGLNSAKDSACWHVQGTCATTGDGLYEGLDWLASTITKQKLTKTVAKPKPGGETQTWWKFLTSYFVQPTPS